MLFTREGWIAAGGASLFGVVGAGILFRPELEAWPVLLAGAFVGFALFTAYAYLRG